MPSPIRWCTVWMPNWRAASGDWRAARVPFTVTWPPWSVWTPDRILMSVDLPAPLAPSSATTLPGAMSRETEASTVLPPKAMLTSRRPTAGDSRPAPQWATLAIQSAVLTWERFSAGSAARSWSMFWIFLLFRKSWVMATAGNSTEDLFS